MYNKFEPMRFCKTFNMPIFQSNAFLSSNFLTHEVNTQSQFFCLWGIIYDLGKGNTWMKI